jgi:hypothetical protein
MGNVLPMRERHFTKNDLPFRGDTPGIVVPIRAGENPAPYTTVQVLADRYHELVMEEKQKGIKNDGRGCEGNHAFSNGPTE